MIKGFFARITYILPILIFPPPRLFIPNEPLSYTLNVIIIIIIFVPTLPCFSCSMIPLQGLARRFWGLLKNSLSVISEIRWLLFLFFLDSYHLFTPVSSPYSTPYLCLVFVPLFMRWNGEVELCVASGLDGVDFSK